MRSLLVALLLGAVSLATAEDGTSAPAPLRQWPQWRGPLGTGVAPRADPPLAWSEKSNVRWKLELPGRGHSSPVVWGDRVYLTSAVAHGEVVPHRDPAAPGAHDNVAPIRRQKLVVLAVERESGEIAWQRVVADELPHDTTHETGTWASASPVTDGERVFAFFGSGGIHALDRDGKLLWQKDLGDMQVKHGHGEGSSPALHGNTLVVNWDHEGPSFLVALDKRTGDVRWKVERDEPTSWSSPLIVEHGDAVQVVVAATNRVRGYDLSTGELLWQCGGLSGNVVATPVAADGMVFAGSSYEIRAMLAIRLDRARGEIGSTDAVAWRRDRDTPYVPSPLLYDGVLFFLKHYQALLTAVRAETGETLFGPRRLAGLQNVYASPVGAANRVYVVGRNGTTTVLRRGEQFEPLASNRLDDSFSASPAIAGDELFLRGERWLYRLAAAGGEKPAE